MSRSGPPLRALVAAGLGVVFAFGMVGVATLAPYFEGHYICVKGEQVASQFNYTTYFLLNSPFGGWGNGTYDAADLFGTGGSGHQFNGSAGSVFAGGGWNLSKVNRVHVYGWGASASCPAYEANAGTVSTPGLPFASCAGCPVLGNGTRSDVGEPSQLAYNATVGATVYRSVIFNNSFTIDNRGTVSTCGGPGQNLSMSTHNVTFQIPFATADGTITLTESLYTPSWGSAPDGSYTAQYWYWFPGNFGSWAIDNLSAPGGPGGGWAFDFLGPCP